MYRCTGPVLGMLLIGVASGSAAAQRSSTSGPVTLGEPRPAPVYPMTRIPFTIDPELCPRGREISVTMEVYNSLTQVEDTLRIRDNRGARLDGSRIRCGDYVAFWDGTIEGGARLARRAVYWIRLVVGGRQAVYKQVFVRNGS
jgi:hypothetical protein